MPHRHVAPAAERSATAKFATVRVAAFGFAALASVASPAVAADGTAEATSRTQSKSAPVPLRWVPEWLVESLNAAIADATDPRDRHAAVEP